MGGESRLLHLWVNNVLKIIGEVTEKETQCKFWDTDNKRVSEQELKKRNDSFQRTLEEILKDIINKQDRDSSFLKN